MTYLLIIGGSDAGISAALRAKEFDSTVDVTVVVADSFPNYSICGLPFYLSGEVPDWHNLAHRTVEEIKYNIGLIARCTQHWSDEEFSSWVVSMVECYGKKSSLGVELADLYRRIGETMLDYGLISSSSNLLVSIARVISRLIVCILPTCVLDELHNAGLKELRRRCIHGGSAWERASLM